MLNLILMSSQGRHVKTGQLAAIKVMDVTEVRLLILFFQLGNKCKKYFKHYSKDSSPRCSKTATGKYSAA